MRNTKSLLAIFLACVMIMSCIVAVPVVAAETTVTGSTTYDGTYVEPANFAEAWDGTSTDTEWEGDGSEASPYLITSAAEFAGLAKQVNTESQTYSGKYFRLDVNLDLGNKEWTPIGYTGNTGNTAFKGVLDGNGKVIKNLYCTGANGSGYGGLFGYAALTIKDVTITDSSISGTKEFATLVALTGGNCTFTRVCILNTTVSGSYFRGMILGRPGSGTFTVDDCYLGGTVSGSSAYAGGVCGIFNGGTPVLNVKNTTIAANVSGSQYVGGVLGSNHANGYNGTVNVTNTKITGNITATSGTSAVGGVVGGDSQSKDHTHTLTITVDGVEVSGNVSGSSYVGGILGSFTYGTAKASLDVKNTKVTGTITGAENGTATGGIVGYTASKFPLTIDNVVVDATINGGARVGGIFGHPYAGAQAVVVTNSYIGGTISAADFAVGGIVGQTRHADTVMSVENVLINAELSGTAAVGGIVGHSLHATPSLTIANTVVLGTLETTATASPAGESRVGPADVGAIAGAWGFSTAQAGPNITIDSLYYNTKINTALDDVFDGTNNNGRLGTFYGAGADTIIASGYTFYTPMTDCTSSVLGTAQTCPENTIAPADALGVEDFLGSWKSAVGSLDWYKSFDCGTCTPWELGINENESEILLTCDKLCSEAMVLTNDLIWDGTYDVAWYEKAGADAESYTINTAEELAGLAKIVAGVALDSTGSTIASDTFDGQKIILGKNIKLNSDEEVANIANWGTTAPTNKWFPIGNYDNAALAGTANWKEFRGEFDGNNKTIIGLYVDGKEVIANSKTLYYTGLFGTAGAVSNLTIKNAYVIGGTNATGVVAGCPRNEQPNFQNVDVINGTAVSSNTYGLAILMGTVGTYGDATYNECDVEGTLGTTATRTSNVGAVIGNANTTLTNASVSNCTTDCTIYGAGNVGGLFGNINYAKTALTVSDTTVNGTVDATGENVGGIIGSLVKADTVNIEKTTVASDAKINATQRYAGGFIGKIAATTALNINGSNFAGTVNSTYDGDSYTGGLIGGTGDVAAINIGAYVDPSTSAKTKTTVGGTVTSVKSRVGGVIGLSSGATNVYISDTEVSATVNGWLAMGGVVGEVRNAGAFSVADTVVSAKVLLNNTKNNYYGGIAGYINNASCDFSLDNVIFNGTVDGGNTTGGATGYLFEFKSFKATDCNFAGAITGGSYVGGVIGCVDGNTYATTIDLTGVTVTSAITGTTIGGLISSYDSLASGEVNATSVTISNCYIKPSSITATNKAGLAYTVRCVDSFIMGNNVVIGDYTKFDIGSANSAVVYTQTEGTKLYVNGTSSASKAKTVTINDEAVVDFANAWGAATADYTSWSTCSGCESTGWLAKANIADGQYRVSCAHMHKGVTAEARSVSVVDLGGSVRYLDPYGVRFGGRVYAPAEGSEYGVLMIPTTMLNGAELTVDTENALKIAAEKTFPAGHKNYVDGAATFTGVVYDIPEADYKTELTAVVYYTVDGATHYSNVMTASFVDVAELVLADAEWVAANPEAASALQAVVNAAK